MSQLCSQVPYLPPTSLLPVLLLRSCIHSQQGLAFQSERSGKKGLVPPNTPPSSTTYTHRHPANGVARHRQGAVLCVVLRWDYNLEGEGKKTYVVPADVQTKHSVFAFCFCFPRSRQTAGKRLGNRRPADQPLTDLLLMIALVNRHTYVSIYLYNDS